MSVRFDQPEWLLLLALIAPTLWMCFRWFAGMARVRAVSAAGARTLLVALLALALAGATNVRRTDALAVVAVVDVSGSVRTMAAATAPGGKGDASLAERGYLERVQRWLAQAVKGAEPDDLFGVVVFDGRAIAALAPRRAASVRVEDLALDAQMAPGTDIESALRLAGALIPPGASGRLALVSDGVETSGSALSAARELAGTPIDTAPVAYRVQREALVEFVDAPTTARAGAVIPVRVGVRASAPTTGALRLFMDGEPVDLNGAAPGFERPIAMDAGLHVEVADVALDDRTAHRFEAIFEPTAGDDTIASNNAGEAVTVTPGGGKALIVDGFSSGAGPSAEATALARLLDGAGLEAAIVPPALAPTDLLSLQTYDLVALLNVAADEIPAGDAAQLATYVSDLGGGLVMLGGPKSLGAGGWKGSPVEPILPVNLDVPDEVIAPSAAIAFVIDSSGSMGSTVMGSSRTQQEIADEATALAIRALDARDLVAVYAFDMATRTVVPLGPNKDPETSAERALSIAPGGGTDMYPALAQAGDALARTDADVKHVIVLSDGRSVGSAEAGVETARRLAARGVSVTAIAVGDSADARTMRAIAEAGGGQFYEVIDPLALPRIFIREIRIVRRPLVREGVIGTRLEPVGSPATAGLPGAPPALAGMTLSRQRETAEALTPVITQDGFPILAHWSVGLGQAAVFASTPGAWAGQWSAWPGWRQVWTQLARMIARPADRGRGADLALQVRGERVHVALAMVDDQGEPRDALTVGGFILGPDGQREEIALRQTAPGMYEGDADAPGSGVYVAALQPRLGRQRLPAVVGGVTKAVSVEFRSLTSDVARLQRIAAETGGRVLDIASERPATLFDHAGVTEAESRLPLWPALLPWIIIAALADIATRRVAWDRLLPTSEEIRLRAAGALRARSTRAAATTTRLTGAWRTLRERKTRDGAAQSPIAQKTDALRLAPAGRSRRGGSTLPALKPAGGMNRSSPDEGVAPGASSEEADNGSGSLKAAKARARRRFEVADESEAPASGEPTKGGPSE